VHFERDRHRVRRPCPALRELGDETAVTPRVHLITRLGEPLEEDVRHLIPGDAGRDDRQESIWFGADTDDHGATGIGAAALTGVARD
jgi:hypothetical protein